MMPHKTTAGNEKLPAKFGKRPPSRSADFYLASCYALRNTAGVKIKILLFIAAIAGLILTGGCVSIG